MESPKVLIKGLFTTLVIVEYKGREVDTFDLPGAYFHVDIRKDKKYLLEFRVTFVNGMCQINTEHKKNVRYKNGQKVLYMLVLCAIYGRIESALQYYKLYTGIFMAKGFELNPYNRYVADKMVNGKQCTIVWYVENNKVSHMEAKAVKDLIKNLKKNFGYY